MNLDELKSKYLGVVEFKGRGHYKVGFIYRGKPYYATTTNTLAIDRIDNNLPERDYGWYYTTQKQALLSLYEEVKRKNDLR